MVGGAGSRTQTSKAPLPLAAGLFVVCRSTQRLLRRQAAVHLQLELAQAFQRDEVHTVDQLVQFGA
jgi:hypothetical protein